MTLIRRERGSTADVLLRPERTPAEILVRREGRLPSLSAATPRPPRESASAVARSRRTGREDVGRTAPLTADEDVGQRLLAVDKEVGRTVLAADEDVGQPARMSARPVGVRCRPPRGNHDRGGGRPPPCRLSSPLHRHEVGCGYVELVVSHA